MVNWCLRRNLRQKILWKVFLKALLLDDQGDPALFLAPDPSFSLRHRATAWQLRIASVWHLKASPFTVQVKGLHFFQTTLLSWWCSFSCGTSHGRDLFKNHWILRSNLTFFSSPPFFFVIWEWHGVLSRVPLVFQLVMMYSSSLCVPAASNWVLTFTLSFDNQIITVITFRMTVTDNILFNRNNRPQRFPEEKCITLRIWGFLFPSIILLILANFKTFTMLKY